jgi:hypothetical protein
MAQRPSGAPILATRLKHLRESRWPERPVKQVELARALGGLAASTISSWENTSTPAAPPEHRLRAVATFFATERSVGNGVPRVLDDEELTDEERAERDALYTELHALRETAQPDIGPVSTWRFADDGPVRLVCGRLDGVTHPYSQVGNPNFTSLMSYADLDAMVELFGHIRMTNPRCDVRFRLADRLRQDHLTAHLVALGGLTFNPMARWLFDLADVPVRQIEDEKVVDGEVFETGLGGETRRFYPTVSDDPTLGLTEDVGLLVRLPNPANKARTLSICSGVYSRGVVGAVRSLTDANVRDRNEEYLAERFGDAPGFAVLMRVPVFRGDPATPDLSDPDVRLFEWSG